MNKEKLFNIFLIALPVAAVALALTGNSVTVFDKQAQTTVYQSFFDLLPAGTLTMGTALAAMLAIATAILAIVYVVTLKRGCATGVFWTGFISACFAEIPSVMQSDVVVLPNVLFPIAMIAVCLMAYSRMKKPVQAREKQGRRLELRR